MQSKLHFCMRKFINNVVDFSPPEWDPTRSKVYLLLYASKGVHKLCIMHNALYIMHYATHILKYVQINSFILLVDFSHWKLHPTMHIVQLFYFACIMYHVACMMHNASCIFIIYDAWYSLRAMYERYWCMGRVLEIMLKSNFIWGSKWVITFYCATCCTPPCSAWICPTTPWRWTRRILKIVPMDSQRKTGQETCTICTIV